MSVKTRPTLEEIRQWPATVHVPAACDALGCSKSAGYEAIRLGKFPARTLLVGGRRVVITSSILDVLAGSIAEGGA